MIMEKPKTQNIKSPWKLENSINEYIDFIDNDKDYHEDRLNDYKNEIFELAVESFTNKEIWDWINNRQD
jgi:hypothetical protein